MAFFGKSALPGSSAAFLSSVPPVSSFSRITVTRSQSFRRRKFSAVRGRAFSRRDFFSGLRMASIDYKALENNLEAAKRNIENRKVSADADKVVALYNKFCKLTVEAGSLRQRRNENAAVMKNAGKMSTEERQQAIETGKIVKEEILKIEQELGSVEEEMEQEAARIPNMTHPDVPIGDESSATLRFQFGSKSDFSFTPSDHVSIGEALDLFDFDSASRVTGTKFYYLRNAAALLEIALINWTLTECFKRGFTPMTTPDLARESVVAGCGFQPRGEGSQVYGLRDSDLCLVGTAEIPLGGVYADQILDKEALPIRMAAVSHCFRQEAGAAGSATRGLYRVHQFSKVEMFVLCTPEQSNEIHEQLREIEIELFSSLGLHFKVLDMPTQDLGNPAYRKYDIEAWMPGRGSYGEISSASNCTDYQARRLNIRYRESETKSNRFVHTLNATACAVPRMILAILETFQQEDGSVVIPEPLRPYMGGIKVIEKP